MQTANNGEMFCCVLDLTLQWSGDEVVFSFYLLVLLTVCEPEGISLGKLAFAPCRKGSRNFPAS